MQIYLPFLIKLRHFDTVWTDGRNGESLSMVGATFPTAPSVRIAKSRQFSMPVRDERTARIKLREREKEE